MQTSSRKFVVVLPGLLVLGFVVYRSSGMLHLGDLWLLCTSLSSMEGFSAKSGAVAFRDDLRPDPGRIFGNFSVGARGRAGAAFVAGAEGEVACFRYVWNLRIGTPFRLGKCGCHCGDWVAALQVKCAIWRSRE